MVTERLRTPVWSPRAPVTAPPWNACQRRRLARLAVLELPGAEALAEPMNHLSAFDGDAERERQICDLRVKGKSEAEVCQILGCTVPDIHRAIWRLAETSGIGRAISTLSEPALSRRRPYSRLFRCTVHRHHFNGWARLWT